MTYSWKHTFFGFAFGAMAATGFGQISLTPISSISNGDLADIFDESAAEIVSFDSVTEQMYVVNGAEDSIDIFDISDITSPVLVTSVDLSAYGNPNSVDVNPRKGRDEVAVAVGAPEADQRGVVVFLSKAGAIEDVVTVGYLPDMLTYTSNGKQLVVANEGEPNDDYSFDPEGSVSIIKTKSKSRRVTEIGFGAITEDQLNGARISGPEGTTIAQDLEPEYIAISEDDRYAYVACQENNAIVVIDLRAKRIVSGFGLGAKNFAELGNAFDASDRDDAIRVANWPVKGLYMPDAIASYQFKGFNLIVTANEGDGREYGDYEDESRIKDLDLDESAFPLGDILKEDENLGRLTVITTQGDYNEDGLYEELFAFGARSFSIFAEDGSLVYDSGDFIETYLALNFPDDFNATNDENDSFDSRSDAKGPEPEAVTLGEIDGNTYAFVGLERIGGIMIFDITDPRAVSFVDYFNNRDFSGDAEAGTAGDLGPEGIEFVPAKKSPNGKDLLLVANEVSGTTTIYEIDAVPSE